MIFGFLAPVNSPPPKRQRTEQQARQEVKQQASNRGIIINAYQYVITYSHALTTIMIPAKQIVHI